MKKRGVIIKKMAVTVLLQALQKELTGNSFVTRKRQISNSFVTSYPHSACGKTRFWVTDLLQNICV